MNDKIIITDENNDSFEEKYEKVLNICFSEKIELIKFDSNTTDEDVISFFNSL